MANRGKKRGGPRIGSPGEAARRSGGNERQGRGEEQRADTAVRGVIEPNERNTSNATRNSLFSNLCDYQLNGSFALCGSNEINGFIYLH